jgi:hypothetical protein
MDLQAGFETFLGKRNQLLQALRQQQMPEEHEVVAIAK